MLRRIVRLGLGDFEARHCSKTAQVTVTVCQHDGSDYVPDVGNGDVDLKRWWCARSDSFWTTVLAVHLRFFGVSLEVGEDLRAAAVLRSIAYSSDADTKNRSMAWSLVADVARPTRVFFFKGNERVVESSG